MIINLIICLISKFINGEVKVHLNHFQIIIKHQLKINFTNKKETSLFLLKIVCFKIVLIQIFNETLFIYKQIHLFLLKIKINQELLLDMHLSNKL